MTRQPKSGKTPPSPKDARAERLAAALRANLRRRKQQARVRAAEHPQQDAPEDGR